eukprot:11782167-Karenia_brevis.AAC.1
MKIDIGPINFAKYDLFIPKRFELYPESGRLLLYAQKKKDTGICTHKKKYTVQYRSSMYQSTHAQKEVCSVNRKHSCVH